MAVAVIDRIVSHGGLSSSGASPTACEMRSCGRDSCSKSAQDRCANCWNPDGHSGVVPFFRTMTLGSEGAGALAGMVTKNSFMPTKNRGVFVSCMG